MPEAAIKMRVGGLRFAAEGSELWVSANLDAFLAKVDSDPGASATYVTKSNVASKQPGGSLATFLIAGEVGADQNMRFLATAIWLSSAGQSSVKTSEVTKALEAAKQKRLGNPSEILRRNIAKGYLVRSAEGFYVTPEGVQAVESLRKLKT